ncbi:hypothetical protein L7F22_028403 [Adiantum nelumboides]|nr:hypothetical protein [Adiantum nelumboides]
MSATKLIEEDGLQSHDLGEGSDHDMDEMLASQEACMHIVPYVVRPEVSACMDPGEENKIYMCRGEDILKCTRIFSCFDCPPIPFCRFIPYAKVRGLRDDVTGLKAAFSKEGYLAEKGAFIASMWTRKREETLLTEDIMKDWDPIWIEINNDFEQELSKREDLQSLSNRMLYVWEGNHRTVAWTRAIKEKFSLEREKYCRVLCTIIDLTKVSEIALLSGLQRMNFMNTHALVVTHLRDEIVNCSNICASDHEEYLLDLPDKDQRLITAICKKLSKGSEPWYPLTRRYLAKILYNVQMTKELNNRLEKARLTMSDEELKKEEDKVMGNLALKWLRREGLLLKILTRATKVLSNFVDVPSRIVIPPECTLASYFEEIMYESRPHLYPMETTLEAKTKDADKQALKKIDSMQMSAQRLVYRFLSFLHSKGHIPSVPFLPSNGHFYRLSHVLAHERELHDEVQKRDEFVESLPPTMDARPPKRSSTKGKEVAIEPIVDELDDIVDNHESHQETLGGLLVKKTSTFIYVPCIPVVSVPLSLDCRCMVAVGDYIAIATDFRASVKNSSWVAVHEHMLKARSKSIAYTRSGWDVAWAADFIFLDLPFGGTQHRQVPRLVWDYLTEEHVRCGIQLFASTLADSGWLLIMASLGGESSGWVEKFCRLSDMVIARRIVILHHASYGFFECYGERIEMIFINISLFHESVLPAYAEVMARSMAMDKHYDYASCDVNRRRNIFIDDECESS